MAGDNKDKRARRTSEWNQPPVQTSIFLNAKARHNHVGTESRGTNECMITSNPSRSNGCKNEVVLEDDVPNCRPRETQKKRMKEVGGYTEMAMKGCCQVVKNQEKGGDVFWN